MFQRFINKKQEPGKGRASYFNFPPYPVIIYTLGALFLLCSLFVLMESIFFPLPKVVNDKSSMPTYSRQKGKGRSSGNTVDYAYIFGEKRTASGIKTVDKIKEDAQISLVGIFFSNIPLLSSVIARSKDKRFLLYREGDSIRNGIKIKRIMEKKIIVEEQGHLFYVDLPSFEGSLAPLIKEKRKRDGAYSGGLGRKEKNYLNKMGLKPVHEGQSDGYVITKSGPQKFYKRYGLKPGDKIISMNGYSLGRQENDVLAYKSYKDSGSVDLIVDKDGRQIEIHLSD